MKVKGLKKAVGDYQRANDGRIFSMYGIMMLDKETGKVWTDEFFDLTRSSYRNYDSESIINLSRMMRERQIEVNMKNVKEFVESESYEY